MKPIKPDLPETIRRRLLDAYDAEKRDLPWRGETDPYRIWISEIMLQQTRVETVIPYYEKWLHRFPDLGTLAGSQEEDVLRAWQGLGYYSRARRLREGAMLVREKFGGALPGTAQELRAIPGIGEYTAGAVASIAFGEVVPAVDGNVKRVLSRLFDLEDPGPGDYRRLAEVLVDPQRPGDFNQALMELGAMVCLPRSPRCDRCPVAGQCLALARDTVAHRPARKAKKPIPEVDIAVVVAVADGDGRTAGPRLLLRRRPAEGLLGGMWEFPGEETESTPESAAEALAEYLGLVPEAPPVSLDTVTHVFSHLKARYHPFVFTVDSKEGLLESGEGSAMDAVWRPLSDVTELPLSVAQIKILDSLRKRLSV